MRFFALALASFMFGAAGMFGAWGDSLNSETWALYGDAGAVLVGLAWLAATVARDVRERIAGRRADRVARARREAMRDNWRAMY